MPGAHDPPGAGKLRCELPSLAQLEIDSRCLACADIRRRLADDVVSDGADADHVGAETRVSRREAIAAVLVTDDGDGDVGAVLLGADQHAFHHAFLGGADLTESAGAALRAQRPGFGNREKHVRLVAMKSERQRGRHEILRENRFPKRIRRLPQPRNALASNADKRSAFSPDASGWRFPVGRRPRRFRRGSRRSAPKIPRLRASAVAVS